MQLQFGSYLFPINSSALAYGEELVQNAGGQGLEKKRSLRANGFLIGNGQQALILLENTLRTALAAQNLDLIFKSDLGTVCGISLLNQSSITGVKITSGPHFESTKGSEYCTERAYSFSAEASYPLDGSDNLLMEFTETLTFSGGKPIFRHRKAINGPAQKQLIYPQDTYRATQTGKVVGYRSYPPLPPPLWPYALIEGGPLPQVAPRRRGNGFDHFEIGYSYSFEDVAPLTGTPASWLI